MKTKILVVRPYIKHYKHLNQEQRIYIANRIKQWASLRQIARELNVSHSTISRELKRNSTDKWRWIIVYDPFDAHKIILNVDILLPLNVDFSTNILISSKLSNIF